MVVGGLAGVLHDFIQAWDFEVGDLATLFTDYVTVLVAHKVVAGHVGKPELVNDAVFDKDM